MISSFLTTACRLAATLFLVMVAPSCTTSVDLVGAVRGLEERSEGPPLESEWNDLHIWVRVEEDPPTYIPSGYSPSAPRTEAEGTWLEDARDGKRLFVPSVPVGAFTPGILLGEATKVTNWTKRELLSTQPGFISVPGGVRPLSNLPYVLPQSP